jgi:hypothetical protein
MKTYKHSGTLGDLIYSLPIAKYYGRGIFYLHLNQINWIGKHYYGAAPSPAHQGKMTVEDYDFLKPLLLAQDYIEDFSILDPNKHEITHNLDRFRPLFVGHPGNYVDIYASAFGIKDPEIKKQLRQTPWISVATPKKYKDKTVVINRTSRWLPKTLNEKWKEWERLGYQDRSVFIGLAQEHEEFQQITGWRIPYQKTDNALDVAEYIAGSDVFIGNQSFALSLAIGLGKPYWCELRQDLPLTRNECYFPKQSGGNYF